MICHILGTKKPQEEPPEHTIYIPYVAGVGEDLRRVCRKHRIKTVFTTTSTLGQQLTKVKDIDPAIKKSGVVYQIPCKNCDFTYIGETKRSLETRLKEHQTATKRGETERFAIAEHACNEHHHPDWDNTSILDQAKHNSTLLVKEAMHISLAEANTLLNRDQGTTIADCWKPILKRHPS